MSGSHLTTHFLNCLLLLTYLSNICQNDLVLWAKEVNVLLRDGDRKVNSLSSYFLPNPLSCPPLLVLLVLVG